MKVIIIGDIVGKPGRKILTSMLQRLKEEHEAEFVVANVENAAEGAGVVPKVGDEILNAGVDVMTSGNHIFDKKDVIPYIENQPRLLRPANYSPDAPGRGLWLGSTVSGTQVAVINIQGRIFMPPTDCPFRTADRLLEEIGKRASVIVVDHHAEASIIMPKPPLRSLRWADIWTAESQSSWERTRTYRQRMSSFCLVVQVTLQI